MTWIQALILISSIAIGILATIFFFYIMGLRELNQRHMKDLERMLKEHFDKV